MKSNIIVLLSLSLRLLIITSALAFALHAQTPVARAGECDDGIDQAQFQDNGWKPKDKNDKKPPHRLKKAECEGCQKFVDELQKALDVCYAKQLEDIGDIDYSAPGVEEKQKKKSDAKDALGGAKEAEKAKPPKGKTQKDLKDEVKKKWEALKGQLGSCKTGFYPYPGLRDLITLPPYERPPRGTPIGGGEQPGTGPRVQPGGGAPPAAPAPAAPKPNVTIKLPDCFKTQKEKDDFVKGLNDQLTNAQADLSHERTVEGTPDAAKIAQLRANIDALTHAINAAEKVPVPCPSPTPQEHGMVPRQPGKTGETCAVLIATGKIKVETSGTGETIGHVADLKIQNLTDQRLSVPIVPMILESGSGKNQHYACPSGQTVALNPHQTKTVPVNGVCLNRNKPPVGKGVSGDLIMNEANPAAPQNPNSHIPPKAAGDLLRICTSKYDAAEKLQKDGALKDLPYKDKQKQKDIVVQWSTWCDPRISQITAVPPSTKDDLKKVVYKQLESKKPMSPETKKKVDQGIDTIFEKVELTTAKAKDLEKPAAQTPRAAETAVPTSGGPSVNAGSQPLPHLVTGGGDGTSWKVQKGLIETDEQFANWIDKVKKELERYRNSLGDSAQEKAQKDIVNRAIDQLDACKSINDWKGETGLKAKKLCADDYLDPININSIAAKLWKDGFELYAYTIGLMLNWLQAGKLEVPWDLMNKALDFMIDGVQEVDKDKARELKNVKELKDKVKDGKEKVEKLKDALEKLKDLGEKK